MKTLLFVNACVQLENSRAYRLARALKLWGVRHSQCVAAQGLDIITNDAQAILNGVIEDLPRII